MGKACLFDSGTQHGRGFRRKEGPNLPHDENCRCESVAFSFTSTEVFHGALRKITRLDCSIPGLPEIQTRRLLELLKSAETRPVPASREEYLAAVTPGEFPEAWQDEVRQFLLQRHAFLLETTGQAAVKATKAPKTGRAKPPAAKKTARVKTVTATAAEKSGAEKTKTSARGSNQKKVKKTAAGKSGTEQKTRAAPKRTTTRKTPSTAAAGKAAGKTAG
ncbi:MAG: hypothetical protein OEZ59_11490, partial [Deltaproteobacteria bacterium]|nr:hypothetical protein [Deltaproteobacteria bacterium]